MQFGNTKHRYDLRSKHNVGSSSNMVQHTNEVEGASCVMHDSSYIDEAACGFRSFDEFDEFGKSDEFDELNDITDSNGVNRSYSFEGSIDGLYLSDEEFWSDVFSNNSCDGEDWATGATKTRGYAGGIDEFAPAVQETTVDSAEWKTVGANNHDLQALDKWMPEFEDEEGLFEDVDMSNSPSSHESALIEMPIVDPSAELNDHASGFDSVLAATRQYAAGGHPEAQFVLAEYFVTGLLVPRNPDAALEWYIKAARQHHAGAQFRLGCLIGSGMASATLSPHYVASASSTSEDLWCCTQGKTSTCTRTSDTPSSADVAAEEITYPNLCSIIGQPGDNPAGGADAAATLRDRVALEWFRLAAAQFHADAQWRVGKAYLTGKGVESNPEEAVRWLNLAARQQHAAAQFYMGLCAMQGCGMVKCSATAAKWLAAAAENGHVGAQCCMGNLCWVGLPEVKQDYEKAFVWYRSAASRGDARAKYHMAECFATGCGVAKNWSTAFYWYRLAAIEGDVYAQYRCGRCYAKGQGVARDNHMACVWFLRAADQGCPFAQYRMGECCAFGNGVAQDLVSAEHWFRQAAVRTSMHDSSNAGCVLGFPTNYRKLNKHAHIQMLVGMRFFQGIGVTRSNVEEGMHWFRCAAERGDAHAQYCLGAGLYSGQGVQQNLFEAAEWFRRAAEQKHAAAQYCLGNCFQMGRGVPQCLASALGLYEQAAKQNSPEALTQLGLFHALGKCVERNYDVAAQYFRQAIRTNRSCANAMHNMAVMFLMGRAVPEHETEAYECYSVGAANGRMELQYELAMCYLTGKGVKQDSRSAFEWFQRAALQGYAKAQHALACRYARGEGVELSSELALMWYTLAAEQGHEPSQQQLASLRGASSVLPLQ